MIESRNRKRDLPDRESRATALAPWTYTDPEVFELEYDAFFLRRWQLIGHVSEVTEFGDYLTADIGRDNISGTSTGRLPGTITKTLVEAGLRTSG